MSGLCEDCRYWNQQNRTLETVLFGYCDKAAQRSSSEDYGFSTAVAFAPEKPKGDAELLTRYDFGCVQFEAKEE